MGWQLRRGLLNPLDGPRPGSPWWRAVNERLLFDGCEAVELARGAQGGEASATTSRWAAFVRMPTGPNWYRAHNASIVAGYLDNRELAEAEGEAERFFLNVVLLRVLYAHALNTVPRLALSRMAILAGSWAIRASEWRGLSYHWAAFCRIAIRSMVKSPSISTKSAASAGCWTTR